ncbi:MAG: hypothetical protein ACE5IK_13695, partial [Acidobacteriota bacterium]
MTCQRLSVRAGPGLLLVGVLVASGCMRGPTSSAGPAPAASPDLREAVRLTATLCRRLHLPAPQAVEVATVPDRSAGLTYAALIRLQPDPFPDLLATLFHEAGHAGPVRSRLAEEAIAWLTQQALVRALAVDDPELAARLLPALLAGLGHPPGVTPALATRPRLYIEATRLALALRAATATAFDGLTTSGRRGPAAAGLLAAAARRGRQIVSSELAGLVSSPIETGGAWEQLRATVFGEIATLADDLVATGKLSADVAARTGALAHVLRQPTAASPDLDRLQDLFLAGDPLARRHGHDLMAELADTPGRVRASLVAWRPPTAPHGQPAERAQALLRLGLLDERLGDPVAARAELVTVVQDAADAGVAARAIVELARVDELAADDVARLMALSPALSALGPAGEAARAHLLAEAGFPAAALPHFARAAAGQAGWSLVVGWAKALA